MSQRAQVDEPAFLTDWEAGVSTATMGARYGIADSTVSKVAKRMGLPSRRPDFRDGGRPVTHPAYALTGGRWVTNGRVQVWEQAS